MNPRLRSAVTAARAESMPNDIIDRAIKRGTGELEGAAALEELTYEVYGPGGVALLVETTTDNKNRTAAEIRAILTKLHGSLGTPGSVAYLFEKKAVFSVSGVDEDAVMEVVLDAGASEVRTQEGEVEVEGPAEAYDALEKALQGAGLTIRRSELTLVPGTTVPVKDSETGIKLLKLLHRLEDHDDVQRVTTNAEIDDQILEAFSATEGCV